MFAEEHPKTASKLGMGISALAFTLGENAPSVALMRRAHNAFACGALAQAPKLCAEAMRIDQRWTAMFGLYTGAALKWCTESPCTTGYQPEPRWVGRQLECSQHGGIAQPWFTHDGRPVCPECFRDLGIGTRVTVSRIHPQPKSNPGLAPGV